MVQTLRSTLSMKMPPPRPPPDANSTPQGHVSAVNEVMIRKCFTKWEPLVDIVIPVSRFNGVSPGPRQLPRIWAFVHFPPTPDGERAAADAIKSLNGTTISELRVRSDCCCWWCWLLLPLLLHSVCFRTRSRVFCCCVCGS